MSPRTATISWQTGGFPRVSGDEPMNALTLGDLE